MDSDFSKQYLTQEEINGCIDYAIEDCFDQYNLLLRLHDEPIRDEELRQVGITPYNMVRLMTAPVNPDVSILLYISDKRAAIAAKTIEEEFPEDTTSDDPELAEIRKKKLQKLKGGN